MSGPPWFYVPPEGLSGKTELVSLPFSETRHLQRILRIKKGERVVLFDGTGQIFPGVVRDNSERDKVFVAIEQKITWPVPVPEVHLFPTLIRSKRFEFILEKATVFGVRTITPLISQRTLITLRQGDFLSKKKRWEGIIRAAAKQAHQPYLPKISHPQTTEELLADLADKTKRNIWLWEGEQGREETAWLLPESKNFCFNLVCGPEGGWDNQEVTHAREQGWLTVSLGERIFRSELAPVVALSIIFYVGRRLAD